MWISVYSKRCGALGKAMRRSIPILLVVFVTSCAESHRIASPPGSTAYAQFIETIDGTAVTFDMIPVPGDHGIEPFWIGRTEVTWDAYDVFVYGFDTPTPEAEIDAVTRPSKPYISMDRGFGHAGHAVISVSNHGAMAFCVWLSNKTDRRYRLPTEAEWRFACSRGRVPPAEIGRYAWYRGNADFKTHAVGTREADAGGLHDMYGNASEWCTGADGLPVTLGGSYRDGMEGLGCAATVPASAAWNQSDPQIPRSVWWLADAGFVGFRVVCEPDPTAGEQ